MGEGVLSFLFFYHTLIAFSQIKKKREREREKAWLVLSGEGGGYLGR